MGSGWSRTYCGDSTASGGDVNSGGRKERSRGRRVFQSSCLGSSSSRRSCDSRNDDHVYEDGDKENDGNASSANQNEIESDPTKVDCHRKAKEEGIDEVPCRSSNVERDEWSQASITNTASRTGSSSARTAAPQSLTSPSRFISGYSFIPGNISFRLSRATSLGSSRAYPNNSTSLRMLSDDEQICVHPRSGSGTADEDDTQQTSAFGYTSLTNRTPRKCHEETSDRLRCRRRCCDYLDNMQESHTDSSTHSLIRDGGSTRSGVDGNLQRTLDNIESRIFDRQFGGRENVDQNVQFSRALSVGRLRDRVRRSSLSDFAIFPVQQDRESRDAGQGSGRQVLDGVPRAPEAEGNMVRSSTALGYPSRTTNSLFGDHDHEVETSQFRESRHPDILENRSNYLERRRIRSQVRALQRLGSHFENLSGHERSCILSISGRHRTGRCTCRASSRDANLNDDTSARASISRIVMLAEALFEVLDEIHQQSVVLSSQPSVSSLGAVPAPDEVVDTLPVKLFSKSQKHENEEAAQCYICLVEYEEGDNLRLLPCYHEFHKTCIDKWLKEVHRVCPLCRGDICEAESLPANN